MAAKRCPKCQVPESVCLCPLLKSFTLKNTKLIILMHASEGRYMTSTAKLAPLTCTSTEIRLRGIKGKEMNEEGLDSESSLFLFPSENAIPLTDEFLKTIQKPITLIVPDGSWKQASKVSKRVKALKNVPHVKLPFISPSNYRVRKESKPENLATIEAIARALEILEPEGVKIKEHLDFLFKTLIDRHFALTGRHETDISEVEKES